VNVQKQKRETETKLPIRENPGSIQTGLNHDY